MTLPTSAASAAPSSLLFEDGPATETDLGGGRLPPPTPPPTAGKQYEEVVLPSGRVVRLTTVKTGAYLSAKERAAATAGDPSKNPDPRGVRYTTALDREMCALAVAAYTEPLDWSATLDAAEAQALAAHEAGPDAKAPFVYVPDPAALVAAIPEGAWRPTTPLELLTPGDTSLDAVFGNIADWEVLTAAVGRLFLPKRNLAGIVGKGRSVTR